MKVDLLVVLELLGKVLLVALLLVALLIMLPEAAVALEVLAGLEHQLLAAMVD
jgi:hypothetical protein